MDISFDGILDFTSNFSRKMRRLQFGNKKQLSFLEDLYVLVNDGIPPNRAIDMLGQVTTGIAKDVAVSISDKISQGQSLAEGMKDWFSINIVAIIQVGEEGGALGQTMKSGINSLGQRSGILGALLGAISYPLMVIIMACSLMIYLNGTVFNQFKLIKPMDQWPQAGRLLVQLAGTIQSWWWVVVIVVIIGIILFRRMLSNYTGEFRPLLDRWIPFSLYRRLCAARLMETLGLLVANGVVFKNALKVMQQQSDPYMSSHLMTMEHLLSMGRGNIADVLSTGLIEDKDILRLRVMAEVKGFEHGLIRMGINGAEESTKTLKIISKMLGGLLLLIGAVLILIVISGIFSTGMSMGS